MNNKRAEEDGAFLIPALNSHVAFMAVCTKSEIAISECASRCVLLVLDY